MTAQELKAAILDIAIRGKLVPQDPNDEPADKLLERISEVGLCVPRDRKSATRGRSGRATLPPITDDEKPFDLPNGWVWCRLGEIVRGPIRNGFSPTAVSWPTKVKRLTLTATTSGKFDPTGFKYVNVEVEKDSYLWLQKDDILIQRSNTIEYVGTSCIFDGAEGEFIYPDLMMKIQLCGELSVPYINFALQAPNTKAYFSSNATGTAGTMPKINGGVVASTILPLPPLAEQKRIVARIEELMPWVERYAAAEEKLGKLDAALPGQLKQSILKSAFAGALVADSVGVEKTLDSVCAGVFTGNSLSDLEKRKFTRPDGLPFIGTKDVGFDQVIAYGNGIRIPTSEDGYRIESRGSTLLCVEGGSSGRKIGLLTEDVRFGNKLCAFVPGDDFDSRYLFLFLQSPQFLGQFAALQNGPRKGAGVSQVKGLLIPILPLTKQKALVRRIDGFLSTIQTLSVG